MYHIDMTADMPVYLQIIDQTKRFILTGMFSSGDQLPTVRQLAEELLLNPNTVAKAFREMKRMGLICTAANRGSFISMHALEIIKKEKQEYLSEFVVKIQEMALAGVQQSHLLAIVEEAYGKAML